MANHIRQVSIMLTRHIPSHLTVAGHRALLSYEGQPPTCYDRGEVGHMYQACPTRQRKGTVRQVPTNGTYASILTSNASLSEKQLVDKTTEVGHSGEE